MDKYGIEIGLIGVSDATSRLALKRHPDRFVPSGDIPDPNDVTGSVRKLRQEYEEFGIKCTGVFPAGTFPQVAIDDPKMYPIYQTCVDLDIPIFSTAGVPGPRLRYAPQEVSRIDVVMYDFPDLVFVTRHGCEPWEKLAWKLMLKWPNLYYSTSAFAPKHYPPEIINYANTRGADKIIYAGYFPMGLSLERIFSDMPHVPFRDHVWPSSCMRTRAGSSSSTCRGTGNRDVDCAERGSQGTGRIGGGGHRPPREQGKRRERSSRTWPRGSGRCPGARWSSRTCSACTCLRKPAATARGWWSSRSCWRRRPSACCPARCCRRCLPGLLVSKHAGPELRERLLPAFVAGETGACATGASGPDRHQDRRRLGGQRHDRARPGRGQRPDVHPGGAHRGRPGRGQSGSWWRRAQRDASTVTTLRQRGPYPRPGPG